MRVEIQEPRPRSEMLMLAMLRGVLGALLIASASSAVVRLGGAAVLARSELWQLIGQGIAGGEPQGIAAVIALVQLLAGAFLIVGHWTRASAILVMISQSYMSAGLALSDADLSALTAPILVIAIASYLVVLGGGRYALDHLRRERRRLRAIQQDDVWLRPPYVSGNASAR